MPKARCGIAFDLDGVMWRLPKVFPFAKSSLEKVMQNNIPFILLTNGGGHPESEKIKTINQRLDLQVDESQLILSHTPLKSLLSDYKDKVVLVCGGSDIHNVGLHYGLRRCINTREVVAAHPDTWPFASYHKVMSSNSDAPDYAYYRDIDDITHFDCTQVEAIAVLNDCECWGSELQVIMDALMYGKAPKDDRFGEISHPPIFFSNPDKLWAARFPRPRFAQGVFNMCIRSVYKQLTERELEYMQCGKPTKLTYDYAHDVLLDQANKLGFDEGIEEFYMIGDNPEGDVVGGNNAGWNSILVRTGIYSDDGGMDSRNPTVILDNVEQSVNWIVDRHF